MFKLLSFSILALATQWGHTTPVDRTKASIPDHLLIRLQASKPSTQDMPSPKSLVKEHLNISSKVAKVEAPDILIERLNKKLFNTTTESHITLIKKLPSELIIQINEDGYSPFGLHMSSDSIANFLDEQEVNKCAIPPSLQKSTLYKVVEGNDIGTLRYLVEKCEVDIKTQGKDHNRSFIKAVKKNYTKTVDYLVRHGADMNIYLNETMDILTLAIKQRNLPIVQSLLNSSSINFFSIFFGYEALVLNRLNLRYQDRKIIKKSLDKAYNNSIFLDTKTKIILFALWMRHLHVYLLGTLAYLCGISIKKMEITHFVLAGGLETLFLALGTSLITRMGFYCVAGVRYITLLAHIGYNQCKRGYNNHKYAIYVHSSHNKLMPYINPYEIRQLIIDYTYNQPYNAHHNTVANLITWKDVVSFPMSKLISKFKLKASSFFTNKFSHPSHNMLDKKRV